MPLPTPHRYAPQIAFTEEMLDTLRAGRFYTAPGPNHCLAMDLLAQEVALSVWVEGDRGTRSAWDVARDGSAELAHRNLMKSYPARVEPQWAAERRAA